jgi:hypothetical protein
MARANRVKPRGRRYEVDTMSHKKTGRRKVLPLLHVEAPLAQPVTTQPQQFLPPAQPWLRAAKSARSIPLISHRRKGRSR